DERILRELRAARRDTSEAVPALVDERRVAKAAGYVAPIHLSLATAVGAVDDLGAAAACAVRRRGLRALRGAQSVERLPRMRCDEARYVEARDDLHRESNTAGLHRE